MDELAFVSAGDLARRIRAREIGCVEILDAVLARVERYDGAINAVVVRDDERARVRARAADAALSRGEPTGPLHGVPMTVKECFQLAGTPTTFGVSAYRDNVATKNAVAVDRLLHAGANVFGKTNVPPWLADGQSANDIYGRTNNPWALDRTPGGSSGGSAAALAAGLTYIEMGSDIASSIRNPAHYCGVFGHKSTYGIVSVLGKSLAPTAPPDDISVAGPLARSAHDLELALSIVAGPDDAAPSRVPFALPPETRTAFADFRIAVVYGDAFAPVDAEVSEPLRALATFLRGAGATVAEARPEIDSADAYRTFMLLMRAAAAYRTSDEAFAQQRERAAASDPAAVDMASLTARALALSHRDWLRLNIERRRLQDRWQAFFDEYDVLLCPPLATAAHLHMAEEPGARTLTIDGTPVPYGRQLFWAGYTGVAYLPSTVAPIALTAGGLPVGVQIAGPMYHDLRTIRFAQLLEAQYRAFVAPPGY
jgi:amidase